MRLGWTSLVWMGLDNGVLQYGVGQGFCFGFEILCGDLLSTDAKKLIFYFSFDELDELAQSPFNPSSSTPIETTIDIADNLEGK